MKDQTPERSSAAGPPSAPWPSAPWPSAPWRTRLVAATGLLFGFLLCFLGGYRVLEEVLRRAAG